MTSFGDNELQFDQNSPGTSSINLAGTLDLIAVFEGGTTTISGSGTLNARYFAIAGLEASPTVNLDAPLTSGLVTIDTGTLAIEQLRVLPPRAS